jgi:hypothetical protein
VKGKNMRLRRNASMIQLTSRVDAGQQLLQVPGREG